MVSMTIKVTNSMNEAISEAEIKTEDDTAKTNNAGEVMLKVRANATITLTISKAGFYAKTEQLLHKPRHCRLATN
jgi:ethanolamine ammonia-lyase small subunit